MAGDIPQIYQNEHRIRAAKYIQRWARFHLHAKKKVEGSPKLTDWSRTKKPLANFQPWHLLANKGDAKRAQAYVDVLHKRKDDAYGELAKAFFNDAVFEDNLLYAYFNLGITADQFAVALMLYQGYKSFGNMPVVRRYKDAHTGFDLSKTTYSQSEDKAKEFYRQLEALPPQEQTYYTIDLSDEVALYLYYSIFIIKHRTYGSEHRDKQGVSYRSPFRQLFHSMVDHLRALGYLNIPQRIIDNARVGGEGDHEIVECFKTYLKDRGIEYSDLERTTKEEFDQESMQFLHVLMAVEEFVPIAIRSPAYRKPVSREDRPPLLSLVIPTLGSFAALQRAFQASADIVKPAFMVGNITPRTMRALESPKDNAELEAAYGSLRPKGEVVPYRPVELVVPRIKYNTKPHGYCPHPVLVTMHDLLLHITRTNTNGRKLARMLEKVFEKRGPLHPLHGKPNTSDAYAMSRTIWRLTDSDFTYPQYGKERSYLSDSYRVKIFCRLFETIMDTDKDKMPRETAVNLLLLLTFISQKDTWESLQIFVYPGKAIGLYLVNETELEFYKRATICFTRYKLPINQSSNVRHTNIILLLIICLLPTVLSLIDIHPYCLSR